MTDKNSHDPQSASKPDEPPSQEFLPPLDFSSIVLPLFTQALLKLGLLGEPEQKEPQLDLGMARRLIDILDLLKDRTKGNLSSDEEKFLDTCLRELKASYLEKAKIITP
jgi:hypothetical protein